MPATGDDGVTPEFKYEDDRWYVSYDEGATWEACSEDATGSIFTDAVVSDDGRYCVVTLSDGSTLQFELYKEFGIAFGEFDQILATGHSLDVPYTLTGADENTIVEVLADGAWKAKVVADDFESGVIHVTAADEISDGKVIVLVSDGADKTLMRTLTFVAGVMHVTTSSVKVSNDGGEVSFEVETSLDYVVEIPADSQSWISEVAPAASRAVRTETVVLEVAANETDAVREATVLLKDPESGQELESVLIYQYNETISISMHDASASVLIVSVDASNYTGNYMVGCISEQEFASDYNNNLEWVAETHVDNARTAGVDFAVADQSVVYSGSEFATLTESLSGDLVADTNYKVFAFAIDAEGELSSDVKCIDGVTQSVFDVVVDESVSVNTFNVAVTPNGFEDIYFVGVISKERFVSEYYNDLSTMVNMEIYNLQDAYGVTVDHADGVYTFTGEQPEINIAKGWEMLPSTEYIIYVCGVDPNQLYYETTPVILAMATTTDEAPNDADEVFGFEVVTTDVGGVSVSVEAREFTGDYFVGACPTKKLKDTYGGDLVKMANMEAFSYVGYTLPDNKYTFSGDQSNIDITDTWYILPLTEYVIYVCGIDVNSMDMVSTEVVHEFVTTKDKPVVDEPPFTLTMGEITTNGAFASVDVIDGYVNNYMIGVVTADDFATRYGSSLSSLFSGTASKYEEELGSFDPNYKQIFYGDFEDIDLSESWAFEPDTEYVIFAGGVDMFGNHTGGDIVSTTFTTAAGVVANEVFTFGVVDSSAASLTVSVDVLDYDEAYFVGVCSKSDFETKYYSEPRRMALAIAADVSFEQWIDLDVADNRYTFVGNQSSINLASPWSVVTGTEYIVFAVGTDAYGTETKTDIITMNIVAE